MDSGNREVLIVRELLTVMQSLLSMAGLSIAASLVLLCAPVSLSMAETKIAPTHFRSDAVPGEIILVTESGSPVHVSTENRQLMAVTKLLGKSKQGLEFTKVILQEGVDIEQAIAAYRNDPAVQAVSRNYLRYPSLTPNETRFGELWGLHNTGQTIASPPYTTNNPGITDADIDAPEAWDVTIGANTVVVAVIDTGVDYTHPDLTGAMWNASAATIPSNFYGYDFADGDIDPYPLNSEHGTHVAGIIAATGNNSIGIVGVAHGIQIMALKVFPDIGGGATDADIISAINYAVANNAHIINMSLGGGGPENPVLTSAVANAVNAGVLIVAAAGNESRPPSSPTYIANNDATPVWPANYASHGSTRNGVISVLATDQSDQVASFSNVGSTTVSMGAPGVNILSTVTGRNIRQSETLSGVTVGADTRCSSAVATCMNGTIFDQGATDCTGTSCRWGAYKPLGTTGLFFADNDAISGYAANINGTITSQAINVAVAQRITLRYYTAWELECNNDYVDVEVFNGTTWQLLPTTDLNINNSFSGFCTPNIHTHTGRTYSYYGPLEISHDITTYANAALQVRFRFVTNGSVSYSLTGGFAMTDIYIDVQASDYSTAYRLFSGTSMASPMTAGVAALVKSRYPAYTAVQLKQAVVNSGDSLTTPSGTTASGQRANARRAVTVPVILSMSPTMVAAGSDTFTLTVNGVNFETGAVVRWNGNARATTFISTTQLTATILASDVTGDGTASVTVLNPVLGGVSNALSFRFAPAQLKSSCFIATAAYGTPMAEQVRYLRAFRDEYLLTNRVGRWFVAQYYEFSPPFASYLRQHNDLRGLIRTALSPLVWLSKKLVSTEALAMQE